MFVPQQKCKLSCVLSHKHALFSLENNFSEITPLVCDLAIQSKLRALTQFLAESLYQRRVEQEEVELNYHRIILGGECVGLIWEEVLYYEYLRDWVHLFCG